jgi:hypothetical protein
VAVVAAFRCSDHPLAGGGQDQVADVAAHESGVHPKSRPRSRLWQRLRARLCVSVQAAQLFGDLGPRRVFAF